MNLGRERQHRFDAAVNRLHVEVVGQDEHRVRLYVPRIAYSGIEVPLQGIFAELTRTNLGGRAEELTASDLHPESPGFVAGEELFYLAGGFLSQAIFSSIAIGALLLTLAGYIGSRTLRAIGRSAKRMAQEQQRKAEITKK